MIGSKIVVVVGVALALAVGACKKDDGDRRTPPKKTSVPAKRDPAPATNTPDPAAAAAPSARPADQLLAAYERARAALASDQTSGLADAAGEIERAATAAASGATPETAEHLKLLAPAAKGLATASELKAARLAFGEVSRHVVALLAADKALAEGKHVFECPMAEGYQKWVQATAKLENPYMGSKMLSCGGESTWE